MILRQHICIDNILPIMVENHRLTLQYLIFFKWTVLGLGPLFCFNLPAGLLVVFSYISISQSHYICVGFFFF